MRRKGGKLGIPIRLVLAATSHMGVLSPAKDREPDGGHRFEGQALPRQTTVESVLCQSTDKGYSTIQQLQLLDTCSPCRSRVSCYSSAQKFRFSLRLGLRVRTRTQGDYEQRIPGCLSVPEYSVLRQPPLRYSPCLWGRSREPLKSLRRPVGGPQGS